jgi:hypothetical protein
MSLTVAAILAASFPAAADNSGGSRSEETKRGALTDDGNAGTIRGRTLTPAEMVKSRSGPANDATCHGNGRNPGQQECDTRC